MEELYKLLAQFEDCLDNQIAIFRELIPILDREEVLIEHFELSDFERLVTEKDQAAKRLEHLEGQRVGQLRKICYLISYDARGKVPNLRDFISILKNYTNNVQRLLDPAVYEQLVMHTEKINGILINYREMFAGTAPRIYRNELVLKKLLANFKKSMNLIENEVVRATNYDSKGKTSSRPTHGDKWSSVRVKA